MRIVCPQAGVATQSNLQLDKVELSRLVERLEGQT